MFSLESPMVCKVLDVDILAAKDRDPADPPGVQLFLDATVPPDMLTLFDGHLKGWLFRKAEKKQGELDGIESNELTEVGKHMKRFKWHGFMQTGSEVTVHRGTGDPRSAVVLPDCKVHSFVFLPKQGGSVVMKWKVDAPAVPDESRMTLTGLKATEIEITVAEPEVAQQGLEEQPRPRGRKAA